MPDGATNYEVGSEYTTQHRQQSYKMIPTRKRDSTVVYSSAVSSIADETYFFNVFDYNKLLNSSAQHRDLLNTSSVQNLLKSIVKQEVSQVLTLSQA